MRFHGIFYHVEPYSACMAKHELSCCVESEFLYFSIHIRIGHQRTVLRINMGVNNVGFYLWAFIIRKKLRPLRIDLKTFHFSSEVTNLEMNWCTVWVRPPICLHATGLKLEWSLQSSTKVKYFL